MDREDIKMLFKKWSDVYDNKTLDYDLDPNVVVKDDNTETVQFMAALLKGGATHYIAASSTA